ncbi:hypothetical protein [Rummeliibacillus suwonensis]|nr:hypothetical protein [Rummeliibacillus suwonensis]
MKLINALDSYFFGEPTCISDRLWLYGGTILMILIGLTTLAL